MVTDIINSSVGILNLWENINKLGYLKQTQLLLIRLECKKNLNLLELLNLKNKNSDVKSADNDFKEIALLLENDMLKMFYLHYYDDKNIFSNIKLKLKKFLIIKKNIKNENYNNVEKDVNILDAFEYLYVKIDVLKKIINLKREGKGAKNIYLRKRLNNIKNNIFLVDEFLGDEENIKEFINNK